MNVFVDTSAFVALENRRDSRHDDAVRVYRRLLRDDANLWTSDYVFDETITLLQRRAGSDVAVKWGERLLASSLFSLKVIDRGFLEEALRVFALAKDQDFCFTDCLSFAIMRKDKIGVAFAFDEDFTRFGFDQIPRRRRD